MRKGRERDLRRRYGLSYNSYDALLSKQNHLCAICGSFGFRIREGVGVLLVVDHDHESRIVRGLLCQDCNRGLGFFKDSPVLLDAAIKYLKGGTS